MPATRSAAPEAAHATARGDAETAGGPASPAPTPIAAQGVAAERGDPASNAAAAATRSDAPATSEPPAYSQSTRATTDHHRPDEGRQPMSATGRDAPVSGFGYSATAASPAAPDLPQPLSATGWNAPTAPPSRSGGPATAASPAAPDHDPPDGGSQPLSATDRFVPSGSGPATTAVAPVAQDLASPDGGRQPLSATDRDAAADPPSGARATGSTGSGPIPAAPPTPGPRPESAAPEVWSGLPMPAHPAADLTGDADPGSGSATRVATAAANPPPIPAGAAAGPPPGPDAGAANLPLGELADHLLHHVAATIGGSGSEVVLHLHPPELGDLTVRVLVSGRAVQAWFGTPHIEVQQLIGQALGRLHADLGNAGYTLGAWVGADTAGAGERGGRAPPPRPARNATAAAAPAGSPAAAAPSPPSASGVSVYV